MGCTPLSISLVVFYVCTFIFPIDVTPLSISLVVLYVFTLIFPMDVSLKSLMELQFNL